jgi:hypothetical protein
MAPVDSSLHASTQRPQYMHLAMSMSKRLIACFLVAGSFTRSMAMHSMGQGPLAALAAGADVHLHLEEAAVAGGSISETGRSVLSGYWTVMGSRKRCENVTAMPSRMVVAAVEMLLMY